MYVIKYIKQNKLKNTIIYITTLIASGLTGIVIFPYSIIHMFFSYRGEEVTKNILNLSNIFINIKENINIINHEVFHGYGYIILIFSIILCILWILLKDKKSNVKDKEEIIKEESIKYVIIPTVVYLIISIIVSPYIDLRYLMPLIPLIFCSLIYMLYDMLKCIVSNKIAFYVLLTICICFSISVIPKLSNNSYTYKGQKEVLEYLESELKDKPMIYIYSNVSAQYNKMMECYEACTSMDKTYIMSEDMFSVENFKKVIGGIEHKDGIVIMINYIYENDILEEIIDKQNVYEDAKYIGRLGRFKIYELK